MKVVKVAVTLADRSVAILSFLTEGRGNVLPPGGWWINQAIGAWGRSATPEAIAAEIARTAFEQAVVSHRVIADDAAPQDRTFRNAWVDDGRAIVHDMDKAKQLKREHLRHERAGVFPVLDAQWSRAFGQGKADEAAAVERRRQALRDMPADPRIDAAATVDYLHAIRLPE